MGARRAMGVVAVVVAAAVVSAGCAYVERVNVDSAGSPAELFSTERPSISADGRYVAFDSLASNLVPADTNNTLDVFVRDRLTRTTERVSVDSTGEGADGASTQPAISADGRYVAFQSNATNLVPDNTHGFYDVYLRDRVAGTTELVSVDRNGNQSNTDGDSYGPSISADGRYVAFASGASNLVPGDTNGAADVFVRDRLAGTTTRASVAHTGTQSAGGGEWPSISADGRYVGFSSIASDLVPGDTNDAVDVFVRDLVAETTERVSVTSTGAQSAGHGFADDRPVISADGRYVAFWSAAADLVPGDTNDAFDVFVRDRLAGTTERVSVDSAGNAGNGDSSMPSISADGRYVAFESFASNLVPGDTNDDADVFVRDRLAGTTTRVSLSNAGAQGSGASTWPSMSADGRSVAFLSFASNLVPDDTNFFTEVFVRANPVAGVTGVSPASVPRGATTAVTVTGSNFAPDAVVLVTNPGTGVTLSNLTVVSPSQITVDVTVDAAAPFDTHHVWVQHPGTGAGADKGTFGLCADCLTTIG